jgi:acetyl esterase/lipase
MAGGASETIAYKRVGDLAIQANIRRDPRWGLRPAVVFIHGGALIMGNRDEAPEWLAAACRSERWVLVSIDYRLAPESKLPTVIEDLEDAFGWVSTDGSAHGVAAGGVAAIGGSAGGYLALTAGFRVRPRLAAVVSMWGYGDLTGDWYTSPSPHPCHHVVTVTADEAYRQMAGPPIADDRRREGDGWVFYQFCRQQGIWPAAVSGWDPARDAKRFRDFEPVANVTPEYPPTLLVHGERDTDVPHDRSELMAEELDRHRVEHRLLSVPGAEHGLDGADQVTIDDVHDQVIAFLRRHLARTR